MLASIDLEGDIDLFLEPEEIIRVGSETIVGIIIQPQNPKNQNKLELSVNDQRSRNKVGCYGVGVEEQSNVYYLFVSTEYYEELKNSGFIGVRYKTFGSKVTLIDRSRADTQELQILDDLRFYYEHKDQIVS